MRLSKPQNSVAPFFVTRIDSRNNFLNCPIRRIAGSVTQEDVLKFVSYQK